MELSTQPSRHRLQRSESEEVVKQIVDEKNRFSYCSIEGIPQFSSRCPSEIETVRELPRIVPRKNYF